MTTKTSEKSTLALTKPDAVKIWSEETGEEAKRPDLPEALDITKHMGEAFRFEFEETQEFDYQSKEGQDRHGVAHVGTLLKTSVAELKKLEGKRVSFYSKGLWTSQMKGMKAKTGDVFVVACTGQDKVGDTNPYQFQLKRVKKGS